MGFGLSVQVCSVIQIQENRVAFGCRQNYATLESTVRQVLSIWKPAGPLGPGGQVAKLKATGGGRQPAQPAIHPPGTF